MKKSIIVTFLMNKQWQNNSDSLNEMLTRFKKIKVGVIRWFNKKKNS